MALSLVEDRRAKAASFLGISAANLPKTETDFLFWSYWAGKSGKTPVAKFSTMDHCIAAGKKHYIKDIV